MNRIDKVIVFRLLTRASLEKILDIELGRVQERIMTATEGNPFVYICTPAARDFLLREGTDQKFGARHLKRAIERYLVFPISNLLATRQIKLGDLIKVDCLPDGSKLAFLKEEQGALVKGLHDPPAESVALTVSSNSAPASLALPAGQTETVRAGNRE